MKESTEDDTSLYQREKEREREDVYDHDEDGGSGNFSHMHESEWERNPTIGIANHRMLFSRTLLLYLGRESISGGGIL